MNLPTRFKLEHNFWITLPCGCCSDTETEIDFFDTIEEVREIAECSRWFILEEFINDEYVIIEKGN
jgi:hypothetical protein